MNGPAPHGAPTQPSTSGTGSVATARDPYPLWICPHSLGSRCFVPSLACLSIIWFGVAVTCNVVVAASSRSWTPPVPGWSWLLASCAEASDRQSPMALPCLLT